MALLLEFDDLQPILRAPAGEGPALPAKEARRAQDIRRCGSAALDLCNVAAGRFDGYWEFALQSYDIAAGVLILEEAGGRVTDIGGGGDWPANGFIATNGTLHPALLGCFPEKRSQPRRSSR